MKTVSLDGQKMVTYRNKLSRVRNITLLCRRMMSEQSLHHKHLVVPDRQWIIFSTLWLYLGLLCSSIICAMMNTISPSLNARIHETYFGF